MNSRNDIQNELKELSSFLPYNTKQPVFTVPEGYFDSFAASVMSKINDQHLLNSEDELKELSPVLAAISKKMPYAVPENYFSNLTGSIPALTDGEVLPEFLAGSRQLPYTVPEGYFNSLAGKVLARVTKPAAKVVSFGTRRILRMAAAAAITGLVAVSALLYFKSGSQKAGSLNASQADEWVAQKLEDVSTKELDAFISTADFTSASKELAQSPGSEADARKMLQDVSNHELDAFLETVPASAYPMMN